MKKIISLVSAICLSGCVVTEKEVVYKKISFADKEGVTTLYYPPTWQKHLKPIDNGTPKTMLVRFGQALNATKWKMTTRTKTEVYQIIQGESNLKKREKLYKMCFDKMGYDTRQAVTYHIKQQRQMYNVKARFYGCTICGKFHVTTQFRN